jgi:hypothetical protein
MFLGRDVLSVDCKNTVSQDFVFAMMDKHAAGRQQLLHDLICAASLDNHARLVNVPHVGDLKKSFRNSFTVNEDVKVLWEYDPNNDADMEVVTDMKKCLANDPQDGSWIGRHQVYLKGKLQAIVGGHTVVALRELHDEFPVEDRFLKVSASVYVMPKGQESWRWCMLVGVSNNVDKMTHRAMSAYEYVSLIRVRINSAMAAGTLNTQRARTALKQDLLAATQLSSDAYGTHRRLAMMPQPIYDKLKRIFLNDPVVHPHFVAPKAMTHFTSIGNIPDGDLGRLLDKIISEKWSMKKFLSQCVLYKAKVRVLDYICDKFGVEPKTSVSFNTKHPKLATRVEDLIERWGETVQHQKKGMLSAGLVAAVGALYQEHLDEKQSESRSSSRVARAPKVIVSLLLWLCLVCVTHVSIALT